MNDSSQPSLLKEAYSPHEFKRVGYELVDFLSEHLSNCESGNHKPIEYVEPDEEYAFWKQYSLTSPMQFFRDITSRNIHVHHKKYIGHQVAPPLPLSALAGLLSEVLNDGMGIYEMGAAATAIERLVVEEFASHIGYSLSTSDGFLTSGGTLANLTALLAARCRYEENQSAEPVILVSEQAHFCIDRAAMTMGLRNDQVRKIPTDDEFRIDIQTLISEVTKIESSDQGVMAIVGCSCSTSTGSYDDLEAIADICDKNNIWMHVDGAHGGAAIFTTEFKKLCDGINRADSVIIDAHKMMMCPALATAVLFKKGEDSYKALAIDAAYLFNDNSREWYNLTKRTYETTKYMMCIKVYLVLKHYGTEIIDEYVSRQYQLALDFASLVQNRANFVVAHQPMSNIVCFRYEPEGTADFDKLNSIVRRKLLEEGEFYIVQTKLRSKIYLRVTIMSPYTTQPDLQELLDKIESVAKSCLTDGYDDR